MATEYNRQYVGARYVPQFFNNPDGSWDWAQGFQYEPLTIVKYGENSYTSKSLVPNTVGSPNLNPEYWANTGNYNGFISNLQNEIIMANQEIAKINSKLSNKNTIILFGDSWSDATIPDAKIQYALETAGGFNIVNYAINGGSFIDGTFTAELNSFISSGIDKDSVYAVIMVGGINDYRNDVTETQMIQYIKQWYNTLENFIDTDIYWFTNYSVEPNSKNGNYFLQWNYWTNIKKELSSKLKFIMTFNWVLGSEWNTNNYFHPTEIGSITYGTNICDFIKGKDVTEYAYLSYRINTETEYIYIDIKLKAIGQTMLVECISPTTWLNSETKIIEPTTNIVLPFNDIAWVLPNVNLENNKINIYALSGNNNPINGYTSYVSYVIN